MIALYISMLEQPKDEAAFCAMYEKYLPLLTRTAQRFFRDSWLAEDAIQSSWESVARNFAKISALPCHETAPYLVTIVKNECKALLKKERKYTELFPDENATFGDETSDAVHIQEEYSFLVELIRTTPEIYRSVLERRLVFDESIKEVAKALKISEGLVAKRYERGRAMLLKAVKGEEDV